MAPILPSLVQMYVTHRKKTGTDETGPNGRGGLLVVRSSPI